MSTELPGAVVRSRLPDPALITRSERSHIMSLSRRYVAELNKPRIRLPSLVGFVGAVGLGVVVGRVTR